MAVGDLVLDIVVRAESGVEAGTDVEGTIGFRRGGSAASTCAVFAELGGSATFIGAVGRDRWASALVAALRADGVRVHATRVEAPTARLVVMVGAAGERSFVAQRGAADRLHPTDVRASWLRGADVLHLPAYSLLNEPLSSAALGAAASVREAGGLVSLDLASRGPLLARGRRAAWDSVALAGAGVVFGNRDEARALTGAGGLRRLLELAPLVVVKEGAEGCRVLWRAGDGAASTDVLEVTVATVPVDATDTTGAGDAFDAGFLHSLLEQSRVAGRQSLRQPAVLRRAALAGHRAAAQLLTRPRRELGI